MAETVIHQSYGNWLEYNIKEHLDLIVNDLYRSHKDLGAPKYPLGVQHHVDAVVCGERV